MTYGKTEPQSYFCTTCNFMGYQFRRGKAMAKTQIKKFCGGHKAQAMFKPKVTKHSSN